MLNRIVIVLLLVGVVALALWWYGQSRQPAEPEQTPMTLAPVEDADSPPVRYPVPEPAPEPAPEPEPTEQASVDETETIPQPLPELPPVEESDEIVLEALRGLFSEAVLENWLVEDRVIERAVVFINSLDVSSIPLRMRPVRPVPGEPVIEEDNGHVYWDRDNAERYAPLVEILVASEPELIARTYVKHYRLFQEAHSELAHAEGYFNDRLVDVIDNLLATPQTAQTFELERYEGRYRFADPDLEDESWGRKGLMRMGPDQADRVKEWLREFRRHITGD